MADNGHGLKKMRLPLVLVLLFFVFAFNRAIFPDLDHGDEFSDACVLQAGENFVKFGFSKLYFLPLHEPHPMPSIDKPDNLYTHNPPLPEIINGFIRVIFRTDSLYAFRIFSLFISLFTILFWYLLIRNITGSNVTGFLSALFFLTNPLFIYSMDSLHVEAYSEFLRSLILLVFTLYVRVSQKKAAFFCLWTLILAQSLVTVEYIFYLPLFFIFFRIFFPWSRKILSVRIVCLLVAAQVSGFIIHFIQNSFYFGSPVLAFNDLKSVTFASILNRQDTSLSLSLYNWIRHVLLRNFSLVFPFYPSVLFLGIFFSWLIYQVLSPQAREKIKFLFLFCLVLMICGVSWYVLMPSQSLAHAYVNFLARHLIPVAAIGFALFFHIVFSFAKEKTNNSLYVRIIGVCMAFVIAITGIARSQLPVTEENLKLARDFLIFKQHLLQLKETSDEKDEIGLNYYRYPFISYYTHRSCRRIFDKNALGQMKALPRYFIFFPYNNPAGDELFQSLKEKYTPLWTGNSARFSSVFLKLKSQ